WFIETDRDRSIKYALRLLGNYERETGKLHMELAKVHPEIVERREQMVENGYSYGDATFAATREVVGTDQYGTLLDSLGTNDTLNDLKSQVEAHKSGVEIEGPPEESETASEEMELPLELFF
ncbi:MAG: hypothetical protein WC423_16245, partial [Vulcanimicrobiota bacterium]